MNNETLARHELPAEPFATNAGPLAYAWRNATAQNIMPEPTREAPAPAVSAPAPIADPSIDAFRSFAGSAGFAEDATSGAIEWFGERGQTHAEFVERDARDRDQVRADLKQLWQADYQRNIDLIAAYIEAGNLPDGLADQLHDARLRDGRALLNDPATLQRLLGMAQRSVILPKVSGDIDAQIADSTRRMRENRAAYNRDEGWQLYHRALLQAKYGKD